MRPLKVYGWTGSRTRDEITAHFPATPEWRPQTREIVAAHSQAEVYRIGGGRKGDYFNLAETANHEQREAALALPGVILWKPLDHRANEWAESHADD